MGGASHVPTKYRASSKGKIFTRNERISIILNEAHRVEAKIKRLELITKAKEEAAKEKNARQSFFKANAAMMENPTAKLRKSKDGFFLQGRNERGSFLPKITI